MSEANKVGKWLTENGARPTDHEIEGAAYVVAAELVKFVLGGAVDNAAARCEVLLEVARKLAAEKAGGT